MNALRSFARFALRAARFVLNRGVYGVLNRSTLWMQNVHCDETPRINGLLRIRNEGVLEIGKGVHINCGQYYNPIGGDAACWIVVRPGARVRIGNGCGISNATLHAFTDIELEDDVRIGGGCKIYDSDFHPLSIELRSGSDALEHTASRAVRIGRGAWVGGHSLVLKGVTIGEGSIVAAGSVVTRSIPPHEIWGGNPAHLLRKMTEGDRTPPLSEPCTSAT